MEEETGGTSKSICPILLLAYLGHNCTRLIGCRSLSNSVTPSKPKPSSSSAAAKASGDEREDDDDGLGDFDGFSRGLKAEKIIGEICS